MNTSSEGGSAMTLQESFALFRRLGVSVESISRAEFSAAFLRLAKRYHPDANPNGQELMANLNAARRTILESHRPG
jgi:curved DNA-binding protein CbpA